MPKTGYFKTLNTTKDRYTDPAIKEVFSLAAKQKVSMRDLAARTGFALATIVAWRHGQRAGIANVRAALQALGYDLKIVEKD